MGNINNNLKYTLVLGFLSKYIFNKRSIILAVKIFPRNIGNTVCVSHWQGKISPAGRKRNQGISSRSETVPRRSVSAFDRISCALKKTYYQEPKNKWTGAESKPRKGSRRVREASIYSHFCIPFVRPLTNYLLTYSAKPPFFQIQKIPFLKNLPN